MTFPPLTTKFIIEFVYPNHTLNIRCTDRQHGEKTLAVMAGVMQNDTRCMHFYAPASPNCVIMLEHLLFAKLIEVTE